MIVALVATATIATALPRSASDELNAFTPQSLFSMEAKRIDAMLASCLPAAD
ncbi:hypothetical protein [Caballeronia sp. LZ043]|uniref:hypothetical protein n=2 Tax=unclassified Caballeronia TaxID=2646786 RepID=UPI002865D1D2|nr:hypothetical protein [Caballeronia sp. LZ043]MDR5822835.1 hypothetical protein [Caballeronia sp. LZ043]